MARSKAADRNLLFGILALQMDFITRDDLVGAMQAWILDKAKSLSELLVEQGRLPPARRDLLEALVDEHLHGHQGDVGASLAAVNLPAGAIHDLRAIGDADLDASLAAVEDSSGAEATGPYVPQKPAGTDGLRYQTLRRHAKGGLGEVFVAVDQALHREVAIKEIQQRHAHDAASRNRFLLEAEITGGLEHPGIVPVYDVGHHADGRPYYAMRFIRGQSLKDAIRAFHAADLPGRDPGERTLAFRQLLRRFVDACNAVAYAHSRGVLHRDLKPANIMLGPYGETLVVDWGLAKPVGREQLSSDSAEPSLRPAAQSSVAETIAGTALGTPAYMSPEQASGRINELGPATDVYSLGATLFAILTGKAPVEEGAVGDVLGRVQRGEITAPGRLQPRTPPALEAICLKALALRPEARYADALTLAADVEHWLADEPVLAYTEPWLARTRRWVRRHQVLAGSAAAASFALLVCLAGGLGLVGHAYRMEKEAREYAVQQETEAHQQQSIAEARAAQIEESFRLDQEVSRQIDAISLGTIPDESEDQNRTRLERMEYLARRTRTMDAATGFMWNLGDKYVAMGIYFTDQGDYAAGANWFEKARAAYEQVAAQRRDEPDVLYELVQLYTRLGEVEGKRGNAGKAWEWFDKASATGEGKIADKGLERLFTHDRILRLNSAGEAFAKAQDAHTALGFHELALSLTDKRLQKTPDDTQFSLDMAATHYCIGVAKQALRLPEEALTHQEKGSALLEAVSRKQTLSYEALKALARTYHEAGMALTAAGKSAEALHQHEQAVVQREKLVKSQAHDTFFTLELLEEYRRIYFLHRDAGRHIDCEAWCERAAALFGRLAEDYPATNSYANGRDEMLVRRAVTLARRGRYRAAAKAAQELSDGKTLPPGDLYNLACAVSVAATQLKADPATPPDEKHFLHENYTTQAIQLLCKARDGGYFSQAAALADLKSDPDLQGIRGDRAFAQFLESLARATSKNGTRKESSLP